MTVTTVYPTLDGYIYSSSLAYATARAGGGTLGTDTTSAIYTVGQGTGYNIYESYLGFDTASIPDASAVTAITLRVSVNALYGTAYLTEARDYDYGSTLTNADWIPGANLGNYTLVASGTLTTGNPTLTSETAFKTITNLKTGIVKINLSSIRTRQGIAPTGDEWVNLSNSSAYLTITYTPTITGTAVGNLGAVTGTAVGQSFTPGVGTGTLGALTGTALGESITLGTGSSTLGSITGTATGALTRFGTVATELGVITGTATGTVTAYGVGTSSLGGLDGATLGTVTIAGTGQGTLGELTATGTGTVTVFGQGSGVLGTVVGTANGSSYKPGVGVGLLGGIIGTAVGASLTIVYGYGGSVLGGILGQCVAEAQATENVILIGGGTRSSVVASTSDAGVIASDNDAILRSAVRSGIA